jgi:hypothetical protein
MDNRADTREKKQQIIDRLLDVWLEHPKQRLGQLICNYLIFPLKDKSEGTLFYIEDSELIDILEKEASRIDEGKKP